MDMYINIFERKFFNMDMDMESIEMDIHRHGYVHKNILKKIF